MVTQVNHLFWHRFLSNLIVFPGLSQLTQSFGQGGFTGTSLTCGGGGGGQNNYGGYGGGVGGGGQHTATPWIHDREVHNLIENVSKGQK